MRYIVDTIEEQDAVLWMDCAADMARQAMCHDARCGSVIVKDGSLIGSAYNAPAGGIESQRRCDIPKTAYHFRVTDKTCCVHAEQRAIMDALRKNPDKIVGARLYFIRVDADGNLIKAAIGAPYCTICSKMALDAGISEFVLWHKEGVCAYDTEEYNALSCRYSGD